MDLLKAAAADKVWQRGGRNRPHSLEGRPKQPSFMVTPRAFLVLTHVSQGTLTACEQCSVAGREVVRGF